MDAPLNSKRAQVTVFVIIALVIVVIFLVVFVVLQNREPTMPETPQANAQNFLTSCLEDPLQETITLLGEQGGMLDPTLYDYYLFEDDAVPSRIAYLCYQEKDYLPCVNQVPVLYTALSEQIKEGIRTDVDDCFMSLGQSLQNKGYVVDAQYRSGDFDVAIEPSRVVVTINGEMRLTKGSDSALERTFVARVPSALYSLLGAVQEAINKESSSADCRFDHVGYQTLYPEFTIRRFNGGDGSEIYRLRYEQTGEAFQFAVRGCVLPAGY